MMFALALLVASSALAQSDVFEEGVYQGRSLIQTYCVGPTLTCGVVSGAATITVVASGTGSCGANTWASTLNNGAAPTCTQPGFSSISGTVTNAQLASNYSGVGTCTNQFARALNTNAAPTCASVVAADISGAVATATALAANPTDCGPNTFAQSIVASGNLTCAGVSLATADTTGVLTVTKGGTGAAPGADDQILVADSTSAGTWRAVPNCTDTTGSHLNYTAATNSFSCGTSESTVPATGACTNQFIRGVNGATAPTCASVVAADISGAVATATALASDPTDCGANTFAQSIAASGNLTCAGVSLASADTTGVLTVTKGGNGAAPGADDQILVADSTSAGTWRAVPNCTDTAGNHLNYTAATNSFSCGTSESTVPATGACTNQFIRGVNGSSAPTCATVSLTADVTGTLPQAQGGTGAGALTCTSTQLLTSNGTAYSCTSSLTADGVQKARLTSSHTLNSATATEVTGLRVTLGAAGTYHAEYSLIVQSSIVTTGIALGVNFTGSLTTLKCVRTYPSTATSTATGIEDDVAAINTGSYYEAATTSTASTTAPNMGPTAGVATANANIGERLDCIIVAAGSGDLALWHSSETAANTSVMANSVVRVENFP